MGESRRGLVLLGVLVILLCAALVAHGALLLAREEHAAARTAVRLLEERGRARADAQPVASTLRPDPAAALWSETVARSAGEGDGSEVRVVRLGREWWWVEATAGAPGGPGSGRAGTAVWLLDPGARVAAARAVVEVSADAEVTGVGGIVTEGWRESAEDRGGAGCARWRALVDSLGPRALLPVSRRGAAVPPALGLLTLAALTDGGADAVGSWAPAPRRSGGRCRPAPENWGDPTDPAGPCGARWVLRVAAGDARLGGGVGQGVLAVAGDLSVGEGARFDGVVLVGGRLSLEAGATLRGFVVAGPEVALARDARVVGSACAAGRALSGVAEELEGRVRVGPPWIGPLPPTPLR